MGFLTVLALFVAALVIRWFLTSRSKAIKNTATLTKDIFDLKRDHKKQVEQLVSECKSLTEELECAMRNLSELQDAHRSLEGLVEEAAPRIYELYTQATNKALVDAPNEFSGSSGAIERNDKLRARCRREAQKRIEAEFALAYYESLLPWLPDLREADPEGVIAFEKLKPKGDAGDGARDWLSAEEYERLPSAERCQLALERYIKKKKTRREAARDYERFIRWKYEKKGFVVTYKGVVEGFEDLEHDLVCKNGKSTLIIQCKHWSERKKIHERHVMQLFTSTIQHLAEKGLPMRKANVGALLITSTRLSGRARDFAGRLNIDYLENYPLKDYPRIKCAVDRHSGEPRYYLPFDRQYDDVSIEAERGGFYAATVAEAEIQGFRRMIA